MQTELRGEGRIFRADPAIGKATRKVCVFCGNEVTNTMNRSTYSLPPAACSTARLVVGVLLAALALSCGKAKSPWARKMTVADRIAWMTACGIPEADVRPDEGDADYAYTSYDKRVSRDTDPILVACNLTWNRTKDRLWHISVGLGGRGRDEVDSDGADVRLDSKLLEPYLQLLLQPVPPEYHATIRKIALGAVRRGVKVGAFVIDGGHGPGARYWHLEIRAN